MEPEGSLTHSQVPATCPYPEPDQSSPCPIFQLLKIHLNIILPSMPGSSKRSLSFRFPHQNPACTSPLPIRATCPAYLILVDFITRKILDEENRSLSSSLSSFLYSPVPATLLDPNILLSTLFSNTSVYVSRSISDPVSHPYTTGLYILTFIFLDSKLEDISFCTELYQAFSTYK